MRKLFSAHYLLCIGGMICFLGILTYFSQGLRAEEINLLTYTPAKRGSYVSLPYSGANFSGHSYTTFAAGRAFIRADVAATIVSAYEQLAITHPTLFFLYGEMGLKGGGRFRPHRTHRLGLSADFMTPMQTASGASVQIPCTATNLWGYNVRLDTAGCYENMCIDTTATIAHITALHKQAARFGLKIQRIIIDPPLLSLLKRNPLFADISTLSFMRQQAWFPHDGHYHIDFAIVNN